MSVERILQGLGLVQASATEQNKTKKRQKILDQYSFSAIKKISTNNFFSQNLLTTFFGGQKNLSFLFKEFFYES